MGCFPLQPESSLAGWYVRGWAVDDAAWIRRRDQNERAPRMRFAASRNSNRDRAPIRPSLQPVGLLAASFAVTAVVSFVTTRGVTAVVGDFPRSGATSLPGLVAGQATAIVVILWFSRTDFELRELLSGARKQVLLLGGLMGALLFWLESLVDSSQSSALSAVGGLWSAGAASWASVALVCLMLAAGGFLEELLFRGIIQSSCHHSMRPVPAIALAAALFAVPHAAFGWMATIELLGVGLFLSWYRWRYRSLWFPIAIHAAHNVLYGLPLILAI